jgi:hypothetical protein
VALSSRRSWCWTIVWAVLWRFPADGRGVGLLFGPFCDTFQPTVLVLDYCLGRFVALSSRRSWCWIIVWAVLWRFPVDGRGVGLLFWPFCGAFQPTVVVLDYCFGRFVALSSRRSWCWTIVLAVLWRFPADGRGVGLLFWPFCGAFQSTVVVLDYCFGRFVALSSRRSWCWTIVWAVLWRFPADDFDVGQMFEPFCGTFQLTILMLDKCLSLFVALSS